MCPTCGGRPRRTLTAAESVVHMALTVLTCGLWGFVYAALALSRAVHPVCSNCGRNL